MNNKFEYDYDIEGDSLFIYSTDKYEYEVSLELDNNVILDIDCDKNPVAFEFLNASKLFKLDKSYFNKLEKIAIQSNIKNNTIDFKVELEVYNKRETFEINSSEVIF